MTPRLLRLAAAACAVAVVACDDPNEDFVRQPVVADTLMAFALTGTPPSFPAGYATAARAVTRADGNFNFDIAFDIDASNNVVIYPQRLVGVPLTGAKPVGLQRMTMPFDSLLRAPASGYVFDSTLTVAPGDGVILQVQDILSCQLFFSTLLYTKLVVDSLDAGRRAIFFRAVHDPNCGFRNLVPGAVPRN